MKTNLFLIYKYWRNNKRQFAKMLTSIVIITVLMLVSVLIERTECRRTFENMLYGKGAQTYTYSDVPDEVYADMQSDPLVESIGRVAVGGKLGNEYYQYTYGAYIDKSAQQLEYLKLIYGRFPQSSGEAAVYDYVLEDLYFITKPEEYLGKTITLSEYAFKNGNKTGDLIGKRNLKIVGIIETDELREEKEYISGWSGHSKFSIISMPVIYLFPDDCTVNPDTHNHVLIKLYDSDIQTKEISDKHFNEFVLKYHNKYADKYQLAPTSSVGIKSAAATVTNFSVGSEDIQTKIYSSDRMVIISYFSVIAIIVSAVSLFGVLFSVMPQRMKSLLLIKKTGCSKKRIAEIILTEWVLLLVSGLVVGIIIGIAAYELILLVQDFFMGLSPLRAYNAEWAVLQVTENPFITAVISAVIMFGAGYAVYFLCICIKPKQHNKRNKARSLKRILARLSGSIFANIMQVLSLALVLFGAVMCYSYFTMDGKGDGYFTDEELIGDLYYRCGNCDMRKSRTDICIYGGSGLFGLSVIEDNGVPTDVLDEIQKIDGVQKVSAFVNNSAFNLFYPKNAEKIPTLVAQNYAELMKDADPLLHPEERNYYAINAVFCNETAISDLSQYVVDGKIGTFENGLTTVIYERNGISLYPYEIGDRVNSIAVDGSEHHQAHDMEFVIEAIAVIPETAKADAPLIYSELENGSNIIFAAPQKSAVHMNTYKEKYDHIYITLSDNADINTVTTQISKLLNSSMRVKMQTISECDNEYFSSYAARFGSIIVLFAVLVIMAVVGYYSMISMRHQISMPKIAVLRAIGLSQKSWNRTFLLQNIINTLLSCATGTVMVLAAKWLLKAKYEYALNLFGYPEYDLLGASAEVYAEINTLCSEYLLGYEMHNAPVIMPIIIVGLLLTALSAATAKMLLKEKQRSGIIEQLNEHDR